MSASEIVGEVEAVFPAKYIRTKPRKIDENEKIFPKQRRAIAMRTKTGDTFLWISRKRDSRLDVILADDPESSSVVEDFDEESIAKTVCRLTCVSNGRPKNRPIGLHPEHEDAFIKHVAPLIKKYCD